MSGAGTPPPSSPPPIPQALGEFGRIDRYLKPLAAGFPGALGLCDDAGLIAVPAGQELVVTTDAMVEGVHFLPSDPPGDIAHKLLAVNLSDLAAKGADPLAYSLVTTLPKSRGEDWLAAFAAGLAAGQERWGIHLLGGDSVSTPGPAVLTVSALGLVPKGGMVRRAGARPGDDLYVSGTIGDAALGLAIALSTLESPEDPADRAALLDRLRRPEPRLRLAPLLRDHATAALDISDGLAADLGHLARAGGVALVVEAAALPISAAASGLLAAWPGLLPDMLTGGDDYEVAFTAPPGSRDAIAEAAAACGVQVTRIGRAEAGMGVAVLDRAGAALDLGAGGWQHF